MRRPDRRIAPKCNSPGLKDMLVCVDDHCLTACLPSPRARKLFVLTPTLTRALPIHLMASAIPAEFRVDIRDDVGKWMGLIASVNLPSTTVEAPSWGFNINNIGPMQASIRSEQDLDDFMHGIPAQA